MTSILMDELRNRISGDVLDDEVACIAYSVDASMFQIQPLAVVNPRSRKDVIETVRFAHQHQIPVIPRGAATGVTGGCLGAGIVIDMSRYMNRILEVNCMKGYAIVEAGVVQDQLNRQLASHHFRFGPDTSTGNRATIGGMFGNNSSGAHSLRYGKTSDNILAADLILADGSLIQMTETEFEGEKGKVLQQALHDIRDEYEDEIKQRFPTLQPRVSAYNLDLLLNEDARPAQIICGSEGTLGITTELKLKIVPSPASVGVIVMQLRDLVRDVAGVPDILKHDPCALELIDRTVIDLGLSNPSFPGKLSWLNPEAQGLFVVEFDAPNEGELKRRMEYFEEFACLRKIGFDHIIMNDRESVAEIWELRKAGLGLVMSKRSNKKAVAFLEDMAVPPDRLGEFIQYLHDYLDKEKLEAAFYGHAGVGLIHIRPMIDLSKSSEQTRMVRMLEEVTDLLRDYRGAVSGEHGDGLIRSWLIERYFGPKITQACKLLKQAFDPDNLMNPGKIVDAPLPLQHLRKNLLLPEHPPIQTMYDFSADGDIAFAAGICNGNGACRKSIGSMCPSFQVTGDELHSTRARATAIQTILYGGSTEPFDSEEMYRIMELCLQCKACKTECPSQVDIARLKSEFLYHYYKTNERPLRDRLFANIDKWSPIACLIPTITKMLTISPIVRFLLSTIGIARKRKMMPFTAQRFSHWYARRTNSKGTGDKVALFIDTFTEFNYPQIGQAAVQVLEALNCQIHIAPYSCCGRPAISKGMLESAKDKAQKIYSIYEPLVKDGYRIVGLEPSCILTFRDEHPALLPGKTADRIAGAAMSIEEYLHEHLEAGTLHLPWDDTPREFLLHGHCHQKAESGTTPAIEVLQSIPNAEVNEIDSGCCGMAGTFGFESEHYELSMRIGEQRFFPAIRESAKESILISSGVSCRTQIEHGTQRKGVHFIEAIGAAMKS